MICYDAAGNKIKEGDVLFGKPTKYGCSICFSCVFKFENKLRAKYKSKKTNLNSVMEVLENSFHLEENNRELIIVPDHVAARLIFEKPEIFP